MAQVSAFIHPTTSIGTFDHGGDKRVAGLRFDGVTLHLSGAMLDPYNDAERLRSCDNLIAAIQIIRAAAEARLAETAVPA